MRYDEALPAAVRTVREQVPDRRISMTVVRDVTGQISVVLDDKAIDRDIWPILARTLDEVLGRYSPGQQQVLLRKSDLLDEQDVLDSVDRVRVPDVDDNVWLVDRLLTNQEWVRPPLQPAPRVPLAVGYSLKGGVGRSTALTVLSWHLARRGKNVVLVDLDVEAPGLGSLLLDDLPDYGLVDWLVESTLAELQADLIQECVTRSPIASEAPGVIRVMPAFGTKTQDYVSKVGRALLPGLSSDGTTQGFGQRLSALVQVLTQEEQETHVVLLDARAGLHDIGAAAVTQLGAEVFLFGRDDPQGWHAYRLLFEHLAKSASVRYGMPDDDLRLRLKMVAAQLDKSEFALDSWIDRSYETWTALYDDEKSASADQIPQTFAREDASAPHYPLTILFDVGLRGSSFAQPGTRPRWEVVEGAFAGFLSGATERIFPSDPRDGDSESRR